MTMEKAILGALDNLERALQLERRGDNRFRAYNEPSRFGRVFGGQLLAQAMHAGSATVSDHEPHSLHAYFVRSGDPDIPLDIVVERVRDGRSMATRHVDVMQEGRQHPHGDRVISTPILRSPNLPSPALNVPPPDELPLLQHWVHHVPPDMRPTGADLDRASHLRWRCGSQNHRPSWAACSPRDHVRTGCACRETSAIDPRFTARMLSYASDYLLLDMASRSHPEKVDYASYTAMSLDHSLWLHRPVRFDEWHLYTQETASVSGHRAPFAG